MGGAWDYAERTTLLPLSMESCARRLVASTVTSRSSAIVYAVSDQPPRTAPRGDRSRPEARSEAPPISAIPPQDGRGGRQTS
jgi:hypothetical protein